LRVDLEQRPVLALPAIVRHLGVFVSEKMLWGRRRGYGTIVAAKQPDGAPRETERFKPIPHRLRSF
jgi:hypothetical protein